MEECNKVTIISTIPNTGIEKKIITSRENINDVLRELHDLGCIEVTLQYTNEVPKIKNKESKCWSKNKFYD